MRLKSFSIKPFRRFLHIEIRDIPESARLVLLAGPNGNGKSSLFDAFLNYWTAKANFGHEWDPTYHGRIGSSASTSRIEAAVEFHGGKSCSRKSFYFRSAYRNDPDFYGGSINRHGPAVDDRRFSRLIDNDAAVSQNYQRLVSQGLEAAFDKTEGTKTLDEFRESTIGDIKNALLSVIPHLTLQSLGNPMEVGTFLFSKGTVKKYPYKNLSGGEKAVFDLLLDLVVKQREFDDTIICIDEPEAHLNPRIHGKMLEALVGNLKPNNQLWVATHSAGMLRAARDMELKSPGSVAVLDFDVDFDVHQILRPVKMDRAFWQKSLEVALDDLASLVAPREIIACESGKKDGAPGEGFDSAIYNVIFGDAFSETRFISIGSSTDMKGDRYLVVQAVAGLIQGSTVSRLIDRDGMTDNERADAQADGFRVLGRRHLESYMFDPEVLDALCVSVGQAEKMQELRAARDAAVAAATANGHPADHIKAASGRIADACRRLLGLQNAGKTTNAFMRDTLAPLVRPQMGVYAELREHIFGSGA